MARFSHNFILPTLCAVVIFSACAGRIPPPAGAPGGPTAAATVERFIQLAGEKNYIQMGWLFGTTDGPIIERDPLPNVEKRMYALAGVLQNEGYVLGPEQAVPGRIGTAVRYSVQLTHDGRTFSVPFTAVHDGDGRWFVEQFAVEAITDPQ